MEKASHNSSLMKLFIKAQCVYQPCTSQERLGFLQSGHIWVTSAWIKKQNMTSSQNPLTISRKGDHRPAF